MAMVKLVTHDGDGVFYSGDSSISHVDASEQSGVNIVETLLGWYGCLSRLHAEELGLIIMNTRRYYDMRLDALQARFVGWKGTW